jgi:hypothetical protein
MFRFFKNLNYDTARRKYFVCSIRYDDEQQGEQTDRTSNRKLCMRTRDEPVT